MQPFPYASGLGTAWVKALAPLAVSQQTQFHKTVGERIGHTNLWAFSARGTRKNETFGKTFVFPPLSRT